MNIRMMAKGLLLGGLLLGAADAAFAQGKVQLQPHRVAYEVSLDPKRGGSAFSSAGGLMVLEFSGNPCDGYSTNFRQVTALADADGRARNLDFRVNLWEDGAGKDFRFTLKNSINGQITRDADGEARKGKDGSLAVTMKRPRGKKGDFDGNLMFPSQMSIAAIEAAMRGEKSYRTKLFDGSEGGEKVFDVITSIGAPLEGERNSRIEPALRGISPEMRRWPFSIAYYEDVPGDRVPVYTMRSITFANGVMGDIVFEFPDFSLAARAVKYEILPGEACNR